MQKSGVSEIVLIDGIVVIIDLFPVCQVGNDLGETYPVQLLSFFKIQILSTNLIKSRAHFSAVESCAICESRSLFEIRSNLILAFGNRFFYPDLSFVYL